jgi:ribosomal protein S12 methylthiotransferase accessory factor
MATGVVFVGPSLPGAEAPPGVAILPPARRGEVEAAVADGARFVGLIDGLLVGALAVSPGELRRARALGARLIGGASLGAIRAAECQDVMDGVGQIHAWFRDGVLTDDDEIVGTFDQAYGVVAYPLVIVREACVDLEVADDIVSAIRELPFDERTFAQMKHIVCARWGAPVWTELAARLRAPENVKTRDARLVIAAVSRALSRESHTHLDS